MTPARRGLLYYVMPHVEGESLRARLDREHRLPIPDAIRLAAELARALDYSHAKAWSTATSSPEHTSRERPGCVGPISALRASSSSRPASTSPDRRHHGHPAYMSPEQTTAVHVTAGRPLQPGLCSLRDAGRRPRSRALPPERDPTAPDGCPSPLSDLRPDVPEALDRVIARTLSKSPADRIQTGSSMAESLEAALAVGGGAGPSADHAMPHPVSTRWRIAAISVGAVLLLAAGWLGLSRGWLAARHRPQPDPNKRAWILVADFAAPDSGLAMAVKDLVSTALDQSTIVRRYRPTGIREALAAAGKSPTRAWTPISRASWPTVARASHREGTSRGPTHVVVTARAEDLDSARVIATATRWRRTTTN